MVSKTDLMATVWEHAFEALGNLDDEALPTPLGDELPEVLLARHLEAILILCAPVDTAVPADRISKRQAYTPMRGELPLPFGG